ncbi:GNAT family N-acetyltransferase [Streptomyces sp. G45]|uniref:GNAT family N-acetyltransferase n=1 Tax=Streptomyces sp. G45 TaxID=3406627 RepID=UPI003C27598F
MNSDTDPYVLRADAPSVETYLRLRSESGLSARTSEAVRAGLAHTWYAVTVCHGEEVVGMGRVVGDGGCVFQIVDICLLPDHQGRGLGKRIMAALVGELERRAPKSAYVSLIADGDARFLYEKFGFRDTAPASIGMHRWI